MLDVELQIHNYPATVDKLIEEVRRHGDLFYASGKLNLAWSAHDLLGYRGSDRKTMEARIDLELALAEGEENRWEYAKGVVLSHLALHTQATKAIKAQPWFEKSDFDQELKTNQEFERQWAEAISLAKGRLICEAVRRGVDGVREPVIYKGQLCYELNEKGEKEQLFIRKYSDSLLQTLLKGFHDDFKDEVVVHDNRQALLANLPPEKLDALMAALGDADDGS